MSAWGDTIGQPIGPYNPEVDNIIYERERKKVETFVPIAEGVIERSMRGNVDLRARLAFVRTVHMTYYRQTGFEGVSDVRQAHRQAAKDIEKGVGLMFSYGGDVLELLENKINARIASEK